MCKTKLIENRITLLQSQRDEAFEIINNYNIRIEGLKKRLLSLPLLMDDSYVHDPIDAIYTVPINKIVQKIKSFVRPNVIDEYTIDKFIGDINVEYELCFDAQLQKHIEKLIKKTPDQCIDFYIIGTRCRIIVLTCRFQYDPKFPTTVYLHEVDVDEDYKPRIGELRQKEKEKSETQETSARHDDEFIPIGEIASTLEFECNAQPGIIRWNFLVPGITIGIGRDIKTFHALEHEIIHQIKHNLTESMKFNVWMNSTPDSEEIFRCKIEYDHFTPHHVRIHNVWNKPVEEETPEKDWSALKLEQAAIELAKNMKFYHPNEDRIAKDVAAFGLKPFNLDGSIIEQLYKMLDQSLNIHNFAETMKNLFSDVIPHYTLFVYASNIKDYNIKNLHPINIENEIKEVIDNKAQENLYFTILGESRIINRKGRCEYSTLFKCNAFLYDPIDENVGFPDLRFAIEDIDPERLASLYHKDTRLLYWQNQLNSVTSMDVDQDEYPLIHAEKDNPGTKELSKSCESPIENQEKSYHEEIEGMKSRTIPRDQIIKLLNITDGRKGYEIPNSELCTVSTRGVEWVMGE